MTQSVRSLRRLDNQEIVAVLKSESQALEISKSLLNILYNICVVGSVRLSARLKDQFRPFSGETVRLLSDQLPLKTKRRILLNSPALCRLLAESCPPKPK